MYNTYVMALFSKENNLFMGFKVGKTERPIEKRLNEISNHYNNLGIGYAELISCYESDSPHLMYAVECLLHQMMFNFSETNQIKLQQVKSDYFFYDDNKIVNLSKCYATISVQHRTLVKYLETAFSTTSDYNIFIDNN